MSQSLLQHPKVRSIVTALVHDRELAEQLLDIPLFTLFYAWLSFSFVPLLVVMTASEVVAADLRAGAHRFVLQRIGRLSYAGGKLAGQGLQLFLMLLLSATCTWIVGYFRLASFDPGATAWTMARFSVRSWLYALPFLGIALAASLVTRSENGARTTGLVIFFALLLARGLSEYYLEKGGVRLEVKLFWDSIALLLPQSHRLTLWRPEWESLLAGGGICVGLMFLYFTAGFFFFHRRDL